MREFYTITELTREFGISTRTLRFYEDEGLIAPVRRGRTRLFRPGDPCHPHRTAGKHIPKRDEIPTRYGALIDWYLADYAAQASGEVQDPVLSLRGLGKELWADEAADDYVRRQRSGWQ